jgi:transaldolase
MISLYLDSASRADVEPLLALGIFTGVTTNPRLLHKAGLDATAQKEVYAWATAAGAAEVFLQAWGRTDGELVATGRRLAAVGDRVVVKVPASRAGIHATRQLVDEGHRVLLTAVYTTHQAVTAAVTGAEFVAPYLGKMAEEGGTAREDVVAMHRLLVATSSPTRVLAASLRSTADLAYLALHGIDAFALPVPVAQKMLDDSLTNHAVKDFNRITDAWPPLPG